MNKHIIIVGAGLAGLTSGIYARQSGFDTTIYESHTIPGGASTSWRRKGYYFEGGLHWLTGSSPKTQLNKLWREVGALDDTVNIYDRDPFFSFEQDGKRACLYRDVEKLRAHLTELSPVDRKEIDKLCADIKKFTKAEMPVMDLPKMKAKYPAKPSVWSMLAMLPALTCMKYYQDLSIGEYAEKFQSPQIRNLLIEMIGKEYSASSAMFTIATLAAGDGGYPTGGSVAMATRMARYYESLGGKIVYQTPVDKVIISNGTATGVVIAGETIAADAVIVTKDTLSAIDTLFDEPIQERWAEKMRRLAAPILNVFVGLGIEADLKDLPESLTFPLHEPLKIGNLTYPCIGINNYAGFAGYAPEGCSAMTTVLIGDSYDYWKQCKEDGTYEAQKQRVAEAVIHAVEEKFPQAVGKITVWDVATPLTYERYLGSFKGSWMSVMKKGQGMIQYPVKPESIQRLYFAGQRLVSPGGTPVALSTGREAVQHLCRDTDTMFQANY